jgi:hypothetical protein
MLGRDETTAGVVVVVFSSRDLAALRTTLHGVWGETDRMRVVVMRRDSHDVEAAAYLLRQYARGRLAGLGVRAAEGPETSCGLDRAGTFLGHGMKLIARLGDGLELQPGWLARALAVFDETPLLGSLGLLGSSRHTPGRPHRLSLGAVQVDEIDTTCFVTRGELFPRHCLPRRCHGVGASCAYHLALKGLGLSIGQLPGLVRIADPGATRAAPHRADIVDDTSFHGPPGNHTRQPHQAYELGQDALITCMSCGNEELEVLTAEVEFCATHGLPVGYTYTMRCPRCGKLRLEEDLQLACSPTSPGPPMRSTENGPALPGLSPVFTL